MAAGSGPVVVGPWRLYGAVLGRDGRRGRGSGLAATSRSLFRRQLSSFLRHRRDRLIPPARISEARCLTFQDRYKFRAPEVDPPSVLAHQVAQTDARLAVHAEDVVV